MAKNMGAAYGHMDPEQRKRFIGEQGGVQEELPEELDFEEEPRNPDKMGAHPQPDSEERVQQETTEAMESGPGDRAGMDEDEDSRREAERLRRER